MKKHKQVVQNQDGNQSQRLKALSRTYISTQQYRLSNANKLVRIPSFLGANTPPEELKKQTVRKSRAETLDDLTVIAPPNCENWKDFFIAKLKEFTEIEKWLEKRIQETLKEHPVYEGFLKNIKGVGPIIAGSVIGEITDINKFSQTSDLWAYAGKAVNEKGEAVRRSHGQKANWNKYLNLVLYKFSSSVLKMGDKSPYNKMYYDRKAYEEKNHSKTCKDILTKGKCRATKLHIHYRALRYVQKKFLSDLYHFWKENI